MKFLCNLLHPVYCLIDSVPELPYFFLAMLFVFTETADKARHVLALLLIYVSVGLAVGIAMKCLLKTERPKERYRIYVIGYDIPSLHTVIAVGLVFFAYFLNPVYSLLLAPVALLYMHSRICLGYHTKTAVVVGAITGAVVGSAAGSLLWKIDIPEGIETLFIILVLTIPLLATYLRILNQRRMRQC